MRLCLSLSSPKGRVPFEHINEFIGAFHRWVGLDNRIHDEISLYSLGWLSGGKRDGDGLRFPSGASWPLSFCSPSLARQVAKRVIESPDLPYGFSVTGMQIVRPPNFGRSHTFFALSPVLVRCPVEDDRPPDHVHYEDADSEELLTRTLAMKLRELNIESRASMRFSPSPGARTKLVSIGEQKYRGNLCPVTVDGSPEAVQAAWCFGAGALTGCGFGSLQA